MGVARSHGCVRMRNRDIIELFELVPGGTVVEIFE
jgi:lipoprotein-anchoring transpeptidase ErfK/SrfK